MYLKVLLWQNRVNSTKNLKKEEKETKKKLNVFNIFAAKKKKK